MYKRYFLAIALLLSVAGAKAQPRGIRIADTLTAAEKVSRNPVILRAELDSLVQGHMASLPKEIKPEPPVKPESGKEQWMIAGGLLLIFLLLGGIGYLSWRHQQVLGKLVLLVREKENKERPAVVAVNGKTKQAPRNPEQRISELHAELTRLTKENESLSRVIKEYNGIQHEFDSLRHGIHQAYKVKNYPGYNSTKDEASAIQGVLQTEKEVAVFAYEKLLRPVLAIVDANKNNPAKISREDQGKLLDGLLSLSLLYIEYLYLRVNELAIGGKMVERIQGFGKGREPDTGLMRVLNTEMGSRALVVRMLLDKLQLPRLSYPVFDETNLNPQ